MFMMTVKCQCDFCPTTAENEQAQTFLGTGHKPKGWMAFNGLLVCPECQEKRTIAELRTLNKQRQVERKKQQEEYDEEDDE